MKRFFVKSGITILSAVIFLASVIICMSSANSVEYMKISEMAEKNSEYISAPTALPWQNYGKADKSLLKTDISPLTLEDFSYIVLDGIKIDMPCTLGDLAEYFEMRYLVYPNGISAFIMKDDITFATAAAEYNGGEPPYSDCYVTSFFPTPDNSAPEIVIGGIPTGISFAEYNRLTGGNGEYDFVEYMVFETGEEEYLVVDRGVPYSDGSYAPIEQIGIYKNPGEEELAGWKRTEFEPIIDRVYYSESYIPENYSPISIDELDFSKLGTALEITDNPCICIYDVIIGYKAMGEEVYAGIESYSRIDNEHEFIEFRIYNLNDEWINSVKTVLKNGQKLGEALVIE